MHACKDKSFDACVHAWGCAIGHSVTQISPMPAGLSVFEAVKLRRADWVGQLAEEGLDLRAVDSEGRSALMAAVESDDLPLVKALFRTPKPKKEPEGPPSAASGGTTKGAKAMRRKEEEAAAKEASQELENMLLYTSPVGFDHSE
jgi:hypothetical protein